MTLNKFAEEVARLEGGKQGVDIAQIKEILSVINRLIPCKLFYGFIKLMPTPK